MDELGRTSRLALAAIICCFANGGYADGPAGTSKSEPPASRILHSQGWSDDAAAKSPGKFLRAQPAIRVAPALTITDAPETLAAPFPPSAAVAWPGFRILEAPDFIVGTGNVGDSKETIRGAQTSSPTNRAELIRPRTKTLVEPIRELAGDADTMDVDLAPSVKRLDVDRPVAANIAQLSQSQPKVRAAAPIHIQPQNSDVSASYQESEGSEISRREDVTLAEIVQSETSQIGTSQQAMAMQIASPAFDIDPERPPHLDKPVRPEPELSAEATESKLAKSQFSESAVQSGPDAAPDTVGSVVATVAPDSQMSSAEMSDRSRRIARSGGFSLLPLRDLEPESASALGNDGEKPLLTSTIHASRLREIARESLRKAHNLLHRGATHSAKKYALDALRSIVAMQDVQTGGNGRAQYLEAAFDALRESEDFSGRVGTVDQSALKRMVAVHETDVLKAQDLDKISPLEATESYLAVAKLNFIQAISGVQEGSDALVLLGKIGTSMAQRDDIHASAVAVTLQHAAVEIEPSNAMGYRELGSTLLHQGLVAQAAWALNRSIAIHPTRTGYRRLLEASRRLGDIDTARVCLASLEDPQLDSEIPVRTLSPEAFAATHRPDPASMRPAAVNSKTTATKKPKADQPRVGLRALLPFGRR